MCKDGFSCSLLLLLFYFFLITKQNYIYEYTTYRGMKTTPIYLHDEHAKRARQGDLTIFARKSRLKIIFSCDTFCSALFTVIFTRRRCRRVVSRSYLRVEDDLRYFNGIKFRWMPLCYTGETGNNLSYNVALR